MWPKGRRVATSVLKVAYNATGMAVQTLGPTYAGVVVGGGEGGGGVQATIHFTPSSLGGVSGRLLAVPTPGLGSPTNNASLCPFLDPPTSPPVCGWFSLLVEGAWGVRQWVNATPSIVNQSQLVLSSTVGGKVVGTQYGWSAWPVVLFTNEAGLPMVPWNCTT